MSGFEFDVQPRGKKPQSQRQLRVGEEIRHALSDVFMRGECHHPLLSSASITVSEVRLSPDLRNATAYFTPLAGHKKKEILAALSEASGEIRHLVTKKIVLKFSPRISFRLDESFEHAGLIHQILMSPDVQRDIASPKSDE
jgi:ribosome-binding factor A